MANLYLHVMEMKSVVPVYWLVFQQSLKNICSLISKN